MQKPYPTCLASLSQAQAGFIAQLSSPSLPPQQLEQLFISSNYALELAQQNPNLLHQLVDKGRLESLPLNWESLHSWWLEIAPTPATNEDELGRQLRQLRRQVMLRMLWLAAQKTQQPEQAWHTAAEVSLLAEFCLEIALTWLEDFYAPAWGKPLNSVTQQPMRLVVLGMGKLGAGELNLSSDIDLIFAYPEQGVTQGGRRSLANQEYFTRLGQKLIAVLDKTTALGRVFRVDMRLRPYGNAGALALSFAAALDYYQSQGRDWERYALIKARVVAGDAQAGAQLLQELNPFVYRRYLDFSALDALRDLKQKINQEVNNPNLESNIKLGRGGIREVEFIVQVFQLIRGGRDLALQAPSLRQVLPLLGQLELLSPTAVANLLQAYTLLRHVEHALQGLDDLQTQTLPQDELSQARIAWRCGYSSWAELLNDLNAQRQLVRQEFDALIAEPELTAAPVTELASALESLAAKSCSSGSSLELVEQFLASRAVAKMQPLGKERLEVLLPQLIQAAAATQEPHLALERSLWLIEAVLRRTAYLVLLTENPKALEQLVILAAASPWVAEHLARQPSLLDELLQPENLYAPLNKTDLADELRQLLNRLPHTDIEAQMEAHRYFRHAAVLRVATAEVLAQRPWQAVSQQLTVLAEVLLEEILHLAWQDLSQRHGSPAAGFLILGYGKLGSGELGYASDLDLVFIHSASDAPSTTGTKPLAYPTWFSRLGQRIIHYLSTATASGNLYEVDMRLRPSGNSGLLVSSLEAFATYQTNQAWVWEHQALVRARVICGDAQLAAEFNTLRAEVLCQVRDVPRLQQEVVQMRTKMRQQQAPVPEGEFHLKHGSGGLVDLEFLVQFLVLAFSAQHPELTASTSNYAILAAGQACGLLSNTEAQGLQQAYINLSQALQQAALAKQNSLSPVSAWVTEREQVQTSWQKWLGE